MAKLSTISCFLTLLFIITLVEMKALADEVCSHSLGCKSSLMACFKDCRQKFRGYVAKCTKRQRPVFPAPPGHSTTRCRCFCYCEWRKKKGRKCAPPPPPNPPTVFKVSP